VTPRVLGFVSCPTIVRPIGCCLAKQGGTLAALGFVGHAHHDHLLDPPSVALRTAYLVRIAARHAEHARRQSSTA
jgi:hypothetical protein